MLEIKFENPVWATICVMERKDPILRHLSMTLLPDGRQLNPKAATRAILWHLWHFLVLSSLMQNCLLPVTLARE